MDARLIAILRAIRAAEGVDLEQPIVVIDLTADAGAWERPRSQGRAGLAATPGSADDPRVTPTQRRAP